MRQTRERSGYLPSLDGWRCLAIVGVLFAHDARRVVAGHHTDFFQGAGGFGVQLFFAISGVLISWRILQDEQSTGRFSLKAFYVRRFFRIQPVQWVYLALLAALMALHLIAGRWRYWFGGLFLYENFLWHNFHREAVVQASYLVGHFWTLAVEEHFYLLISLFFFLVRGARVKVLGVSLLGLVLGQMLLQHRFWSWDVSDRRTYWAIQYLIFAAWCALLLRRNPTVLAWVERHLQPWRAFLLSVVLVFVHHFLFNRREPYSPHSMLYADSTPLFYSFTGWVVASMLHPDSWTTRFLELRPLRYVGRISYSLYIWHLFFFGGGAAERCRISWLTTLNQYEVTRWGMSLLVASISYRMLERPMVRLGHKLAPPATAGHRDLRVREESRTVAVAQAT